jgi:hypothetical protein
MCFLFMTNKQIKNSCVEFFNVLKFSRFIAQPCIMFLKAEWIEVQ